MTRQELILLGDLNYVEALREQTRACAGTIIEEEGMVLMKGSDPHPIMNYAVRMDPSIEAQVALELMADFFGALRHGYTLVLRNAHDESELGERAKRGGLVDLLAPPEMIVEEPLPSAAAPHGAELRRVEDAVGVAAFREVAAEAWMTYGIPSKVTSRVFASKDFLMAPHVDAVVCYERGRPVSGALLLLSHGIAGIYWVSTLSTARGKGYAEACTRWATNRGFERGARVVSLQASPMGHPIYRRMGFRDIATYRLLAALPADG
jgi:ribosomal protein S18 acetylase RimI-like enzyme